MSERARARASAVDGRTVADQLPKSATAPSEINASAKIDADADSAEAERITILATLSVNCSVGFARCLRVCVCV